MNDIAVGSAPGVYDSAICFYGNLRVEHSTQHGYTNFGEGKRQIFEITAPALVQGANLAS